jgi:hypothetical protein
VTAWQWLVDQGLYRDLLATTVAMTGAHLVLWRPLRRHRRVQEQIADRLDTSTPGGLGDLTAALQGDGRTGAVRGDGMSGGKWNYQSWRIKDSAEMIGKFIEAISESEHIIDWAESGDTARRREDGTGAEQDLYDLWLTVFDEVYGDD